MWYKQSSLSIYHLQLDTSEQLKNISQLKVYQYSYNEDFADYAGLSENERIDTGVLAQELSRVLPDAVMETGDIVLPSGQILENFLVVNKVCCYFLLIYYCRYLAFYPTLSMIKILPWQTSEQLIDKLKVYQYSYNDWFCRLRGSVGCNQERIDSSKMVC